MRRVFIIGTVLSCLLLAPSVWAETSVIRSVAELRKLGISVERLRHDTPMASMEIGSLVEPGKSSGEYDHTECVVLSEMVDPDRLPLADAETLDSVKVVRRNESAKTRSIFLVTGKDLPRTYLAFQFNAREGEASKSLRYLFPIGQIIGSKR
ncbi:MAG: hypothetical protein QM790_17710 [Nibricoccus sp.]